MFYGNYYLKISVHHFSPTSKEGYVLLKKKRYINATLTEEFACHNFLSSINN